MSFECGVAIGFYLGMGTGIAFMTIGQVGFGRGISLLWRVPALVLFWPAAFIAAIADLVWWQS